MDEDDIEYLKEKINGLEGLTVVDSYQAEHTITKVIGEGGQGIVCLTRNPDIAIKLITQDGKLLTQKKFPKECDEHYADLRRIFMKPFPRELHLALPLASLLPKESGYVGYVMRLMGDMEAFGALLGVKNFAIGGEASKGGHRRRVALLARLAAILARLHAVPMVYCDISPNNVFVTKDAAFKEQNVWLIDCDNVFVPSVDEAKCVYTQKYAAPEILNGDLGCTDASDMWSFAVMAFEAMFCALPICETGGEDFSDWDASSSQQADDAQKELCYVFNSADESGKGFLPMAGKLLDKRTRSFLTGLSAKGLMI